MSLDLKGAPMSTRAFTPARIVALVLIGVAILALGYVRFEPDPGPVSVPAGAQAGDLVLEDCEYQTESGSYAADCGTLVVPENRADPESRLIALPVTRIKARSGNPAEPIFRLEGGPGITNMQFSKASRLADNHDVVLVGYRGVDGSVRLDCPEVDDALAHSTDLLGEDSFRAYGDAFRDCATRLEEEGADLSSYGLVQQVEDLEAARKALGYERINLISESAGTRTAMIYAWRYPESIHRSAMIAVNPPGHYLWDAETTDEQIGRYSELCQQDEECSERTDDLAAALGRTSADLPDRWLFLPVDDASVRIFSFYGLMESTPEAAPLSGPTTLDAWLSADDGDASGFWLQSLFGELFPIPFVWGQYASAGRVDAQAARAYFAGDQGFENLGRAASAFAWGGGRLVDAWPAAQGENEYGTVRTSDVETLLVGGTLDFATPPQVATEELLPHLPNGQQVVLGELGHTVDFWSYQPEAQTRLLTTFFDTGRVDDSLYEPAQVDFTPTARLPTLAKGIAAGMVGLGLLTVLSLLWMARRVHWQGRLGRKTSAVLRSAYAPVLGLGGWLGAVLVVTTTMPSVAAGGELPAALSVGLPVGLGVYLAWTHRDWSRRTKATGLAAAAGGALVGAWLGFNATEGLVALLTTILGAVAGANLLVVALDLAWDRQARDRFAETEAERPLEASPTAG
jgi:pimeloyl-ACP methyl ester carboxylesterase